MYADRGRTDSNGLALRFWRHYYAVAKIKACLNKMKQNTMARKHAGKTVEQGTNQQVHQADNYQRQVVIRLEYYDVLSKQRENNNDNSN